MGDKRSHKRKRSHKEVGSLPPPADDASQSAELASEAPLQKMAAHASKKLRQQQAEQQKERQRKIAEANRAIKREKRRQRVKKEKPRRDPASAAAAGACQSPGRRTSPQYAIEYVRRWRDDRPRWKFQKLVQAWLLHHLLDHTQIPRSDFALVTEYALTVRGAARARLLAELRAVVEARDRWPALMEEGKTDDEARDSLGREKPGKKAYGRARKLLQLFDDDDGPS